MTHNNTAAVTWAKVLLALAVQTAVMAYYFGASMAKIETNLEWVRQRQNDNFTEHREIIDMHQREITELKSRWATR